MSSNPRIPESENQPNFVRLKLSSLIVLCVSLIGATALGMGLVMFGLIQVLSQRAASTGNEFTLLTTSKPDTNPPWGELVKLDLEVEQPDEYVAFEPLTNRLLKWFFPGRTPAQVRELMTAVGFEPKQIEAALHPAIVEVEDDATVITPGTELVASLSPVVRKNFYTELSRSEQNRYMRFPYCFMTNRAEEFFAKSGVAADIVKQVSQLTYERNGTFYFSDVEVVLNQIPTTEERQLFFKTLSRSFVVMARLCVRPDTDVDKLLGYWSGSKFVRQKDLKPLLESFKRREEGGTVSLMYLLPPFARERLFTSPLPSLPGDPNMDCHWSAMNFFNSEPNFQFSDLTYTAAYVKSNYYQIAQPGSYGDIVFLLDQDGNAIHSAVYIADDIVFTKNGNNYAQPWVLMRLPNLLALYNVSDTPRMACYRQKNS